jgi:hypothetical protein
MLFFKINSKSWQKYKKNAASAFLYVTFFYDSVSGSPSRHKKLHHINDIATILFAY